jgi:hypothetical protein
MTDDNQAIAAAPRLRAPGATDNSPMTRHWESRQNEHQAPNGAARFGELPDPPRRSPLTTHHSNRGAIVGRPKGSEAVANCSIRPWAAARCTACLTEVGYPPLFPRGK